MGISFTRESSGTRRHVTCCFDAIISLPLIVHILNELTKTYAQNKNAPNFSSLFPKDQKQKDTFKLEYKMLINLVLRVI